MCNAWPKHRKYTCGARCVKYTTNDSNMFLMSKHEKPQSLVLIEIRICEKMPKRHFIKHLACTLWTLIWNNAWTSWNPPFVQVLFATRGQTSKVNHQKKPNPYKNLTKNKFSQPLWWKSQPRAQNTPKHNLRIQINGMKWKFTLKMLMEWKKIQIDWILM